MNYRIIRDNWQLFYGSLYGVLWYRINSHTNVLWNKLHTKASFARSCLDRYWSARPNRPAWPGNDPNQTSMFIDALSLLPRLSPYKAPKPQTSEGRIDSDIDILNKPRNIYKHIALKYNGKSTTTYSRRSQLRSLQAAPICSLGLS